MVQCQRCAELRLGVTWPRQSLQHLSVAFTWLPEGWASLVAIILVQDALLAGCVYSKLSRTPRSKVSELYAERVICPRLASYRVMVARICISCSCISRSRSICLGRARRLQSDLHDMSKDLTSRLCCPTPAFYVLEDLFVLDNRCCVDQHRKLFFVVVYVEKQSLGTPDNALEPSASLFKTPAYSSSLSSPKHTTSQLSLKR